MPKADIIAQLQREILPLQGYKSSFHNTGLDVGLGQISAAFPSSVFPLGAVHEMLCNTVEEATASSGFLAGILSSILKNGGTVMWIGAAPCIFPPSLKAFGVNPDNIIFLTIQKEKDILWAMEEALKCASLSVVVGEINDISFNTSRRFQLAVELSGVTSFLLRRNPRNLTTACVCRWHVTPLSSVADDAMPGVGHPRWKVELLKVRSGSPGAWEIEWKEGRFNQVYKILSIIKAVERKTG